MNTIFRVVTGCMMLHMLVMMINVIATSVINSTLYVGKLLTNDCTMCDYLPYGYAISSLHIWFGLNIVLLILVGLNIFTLMVPSIKHIINTRINVYPVYACLDILAIIFMCVYMCTPICSYIYYVYVYFSVDCLTQLITILLVMTTTVILSGLSIFITSLMLVSAACITSIYIHKPDNVCVFA